MANGVKIMFLLTKWEPILYLDNHSLDEQLKLLKQKENLSPKEQLQMRFLEYGILGEKGVLYELQNSHLGMYILHDLKIKYQAFEVQIDFLVMTEKSIYVIECKNLYGNITINSRGDFIREILINDKKEKSGIYSPITQVERHVELLKKITYDKYNKLEKLLYGNKLDSLFEPIVVLANEKTLLNDYYAPKEIKKKIVRKDGLISYIKKLENQKERLYKEKDIKDYCNHLISYQIILDKTITEEKIVNQDVLYQRLKEYRLNKSKEENLKPYMVFSDKTLEDLICKMPKTLEELLLVEGFGEFKVNKYGKDILSILEEDKIYENEVL